MSGKVLIYGGSGAVGSASARLLKAKGYDLHLVGTSEEKLSPLAQELGADISIADVMDTESFKKVAKEAGGELAGLIYAAGTINLKSMRRLTEEDFLRDFRLNSLGAALAVQASLSALNKYKEGSSIVLYSSIAVQQGFQLHASIGMAKGAIEGLVRSLAAEFAPKIRVNGIAPSLIEDSPLSSGILADDVTKNSIGEKHSLKRLGKAEDIAALTAFLISKESSWITGQIYGVDGGRSRVQL